jgi:hypothetical protein
MIIHFPAVGKSKKYHLYELPENLLTGNGFGTPFPGRVDINYVTPQGNIVSVNIS